MAAGHDENECDTRSRELLECFLLQATQNTVAAAAGVNAAPVSATALKACAQGAKDGQGSDAAERMSPAKNRRLRRKRQGAQRALAQEAEKETVDSLAASLRELLNKQMLSVSEAISSTAQVSSAQAPLVPLGTALPPCVEQDDMEGDSALRNVDVTNVPAECTDGMVLRAFGSAGCSVTSAEVIESRCASGEETDRQLLLRFESADAAMLAVGRAAARKVLIWPALEPHTPVALRAGLALGGATGPTSPCTTNSGAPVASVEGQPLQAEQQGQRPQLQGWAMPARPEHASLPPLTPGKGLGLPAIGSHQYIERRHTAHTQPTSAGSSPDSFRAGSGCTVALQTSPGASTVTGSVVEDSPATGKSPALTCVDSEAMEARSVLTPLQGPTAWSALTATPPRTQLLGSVPSATSGESGKMLTDTPARVSNRPLDFTTPESAFWSTTNSDYQARHAAWARSLCLQQMQHQQSQNQQLQQIQQIQQLQQLQQLHQQLGLSATPASQAAAPAPQADSGFASMVCQAQTAQQQLPSSMFDAETPDEEPVQTPAAPAPQLPELTGVTQQTLATLLEGVFRLGQQQQQQLQQREQQLQLQQREQQLQQQQQQQKQQEQEQQPAVVQAQAASDREADPSSSQFCGHAV